MTYQEFTAALTAGLLNKEVVINYNTYPGQVVRIDAIAIKVTDSNLQELREATAITVKVPQTGVYVTVNISNSTNPFREVDRVQQGGYFCYNIKTEAQRPVIAAPTTSLEIYYSEILTEPITPVGPYEYNDYNPFLGNIGRSRTSDYIVHSDRDASNTNPTNIGSILGNQAIEAGVQDSNYSSTGWVHARYEGSKLTTVNNHNTDPFLQGTFFEGSIFSNTVQDAYIQNLQTTTTLNYSQMFFSSVLDSPRYAVEDLNLKVDTGTYSISSSLLLLTNKVIPPLNRDLKIDDLLILSGSSGIRSEILQVIAPITTQQYYPYESLDRQITYEHASIRTLRGYSDTKRVIPDDTVTADSVYRLVTTRVYTLLNNVIQPLTAGKLIVKGTDEVLYIDNRGVVVGGSTVVEL